MPRTVQSAWKPGAHVKVGVAVRDGVIGVATADEASSGQYLAVGHGTPRQWPGFRAVWMHHWGAAVEASLGEPIGGQNLATGHGMARQWPGFRAV
jgi:hypothetical protein